MLRYIPKAYALAHVKYKSSQVPSNRQPQHSWEQP